MDESRYIKTEDQNGVITFTPIKREVKCWEGLGEVSGYYLDEENYPIYTKTNSKCDEIRDVFVTKEQCEASKALAMLSQLMKECNGDWEPNYGKACLYTLVFDGDTVVGSVTTDFRRFLTFRTREDRDRFMELHIDLINEAKALL